MSQAAAGAEEIATTIRGVAAAAAETSQGVEEARAAAAELATLAEGLAQAVSRFRVEGDEPSEPAKPSSGAAYASSLDEIAAQGATPATA